MPTKEEVKREHELIKRFSPAKYAGIEELTIAGWYQFFSMRQKLLEFFTYGENENTISKSRAIVLITELIKDPFLGETPAILNNVAPEYVPDNLQTPVKELTPGVAAAFLLHFKREAPELFAAVMEFARGSAQLVTIRDKEIIQHPTRLDDPHNFPEELLQKAMLPYVLIMADLSQNKRDFQKYTGRFYDAHKVKYNLERWRKTRKKYDMKKWAEHLLPGFIDLQLACDIYGVRCNYIQAIAHFLPDYEAPEKLRTEIKREIRSLMHPYICDHLAEMVALEHPTPSR